MWYSLAFFAQSFAEDGHDHGAAESCLPADDLQLMCTNQAENCSFTVSVIIPLDEHLHDLHDPCSKQSETCSMGKNAEGMYDGYCDLNPAVMETLCKGDQHCVVDAAKACQAFDDHSCLGPTCIWHNNCVTSDTYCEAHEDCHLDAGCGHIDITCPDLLSIGETHVHYNCANKAVVAQLDEYCNNKSGMGTHSTIIYCIELAAMILASCAVTIFGVGKSWSQGTRVCVDIIAAGLGAFFLSCSLTDMLHESFEYSELASWRYSGIPFSPHWVIFTMTCFTVFLFVHASAWFVNRGTPKMRLIALIGEISYEAFVIGVLIGGHWTATVKWIVAIIAITFFLLRIVRMPLGAPTKAKAAIIALTTAPCLFLGDFLTTNYFLSPQAGLEGSSTWFALAAAAQFVMAVLAISRGAGQCLSKLHLLCLCLALVGGLLVCLGVFFMKPAHTAAFNEMILKNVADGLGLGHNGGGDDHDHDH